MTLDQISVCSIDTFNISNKAYFVILNMKTKKTRGYNFLNFPSKVNYATSMHWQIELLVLRNLVFHCHE